MTKRILEKTKAGIYKIPIPEEIIKELGLKEGTYFTITLEGKKIILESIYWKNWEILENLGDPGE